jgi:TLC domain
MSKLLRTEAFNIFPFSKLTQLEQNFDFIILSALFLHGVYLLGGFLSWQFSFHYRTLNLGKQASWRIHLVSLIFSTIVIPLSLLKPSLQDNLFGSSLFASKLYSFTIGYFLWDVCITILHFDQTGWPFLFHALACMCVFSFSLYPFAQGYGQVFLLFEVSTVFLNIHW